MRYHARIIGTDTAVWTTLRADRRTDPYGPTNVRHGRRAFIRVQGRTVSGHIDRALDVPVFVPTGINRSLCYSR